MHQLRKRLGHKSILEYKRDQPSVPKITIGVSLIIENPFYFHLSRWILIDIMTPIKLLIQIIYSEIKAPQMELGRRIG
jgi:hypothetical protein